MAIKRYGENDRVITTPTNADLLGIEQGTTETLDDMKVISYGNFVKPVVDQIDEIKGDGWVDETVKGNASNIATLETNKADKSTTYTQTEVDNIATALQDNIDEKANSADVYTQTEVDNIASGLQDNIDEKANSANVYTKVEVDASQEAQDLVIAEVQKDLLTNTERLSSVNSQLAQTKLAGDTITNSDYGSVVLSGQALKAKADFELSGLTATNLVDMELENWVDIVSTNSLDGTNITNTGDGTSIYPSLQHLINAVAGDKLCFILKLRVTNPDATALQILLQTTLNEAVYTISSPVENQWYYITAIHSVANSKNNAYLKIIHRYADASTANGKVMEIAGGEDGVRAINLTQTFGAGNEPTADECAKIFPTYFDGLQSISGKGAIEIGGSNLFDDGLYSIEIGDIIDTTGQNTSSSNRFRLVEYFPVQPSTNYTLSVSNSPTFVTVHFYTADYTFISYTPSSNDFNTFITPLNCAYVRFKVGTTDLSANIMLNLGSTALPYEPYREPSKLFYDTETLKSVPNGVADKLKLENGVLSRGGNIKEYTLQASDIIEFNNGWSDVDSVSVNLLDATNLGALGTLKGHIYIENWSEAVTINSTVSINKHVERYIDASKNYLYFVTAKGTYASLAEAQADLAGTVIQYQLAEPTTEELAYVGNTLASPYGNANQLAETPNLVIAESTTISTPNITSLVKLIHYDDGLEAELDISLATIGTDTITHPDIIVGEMYSVIYKFDTNGIQGKLDVTVGNDDSLMIDETTDEVIKDKLAIDNGIPKFVFTGEDGVESEYPLASIAQEDWIEPTFLNGWSGTFKYRKNSLGEVVSKGYIGGGIAGTQFIQFITGYRPTEVSLFSFNANNMLGTGYVDTLGRAYIVTAGSTSQIGVSPIRFFTD